MFRRLLATTLARRAGEMPVVAVVGPRQSGKTTLVREVFPNHLYLSLERPDVRAEAVEDPVGFLAQAADGAILDEVQRAPELPSYIQGMVDEDDRPGRFILTGSQNLLLMEQVSQTLAGRVAPSRPTPSPPCAGGRGWRPTPTRAACWSTVTTRRACAAASWCGRGFWGDPVDGTSGLEGRGINVPLFMVASERQTGENCPPAGRP